MKIKSLGKALSFRGNFLALALIAFSFSTQAQVYQVDAAYGRQIRRYMVDTTLIIPTVCGVPTLRSTVTNKAAIAVDSCNKVFYFYDPKTATWNTISGGGGGSTGISSLGTGYGLITVNDSTYRVDSTVMVNIARLNNFLALKANQQALVDTAAAIRAAFPAGGTGSIEYVEQGYGIKVDSSGRTYTVRTDTTLIGSKSYVDAKDALKQNTLTAGTNISIVGDVISSSGGGGGSAKLIWVNLADYADSTGATDATAGINNAIAATAEGGTLFVPAGVYKTSGSHVVTRKIKIIGAGGAGNLEYVPIGLLYRFRRGASVIFSTSDTSTVFDLRGEPSIFENIDLRLDSTITPSATAIGLRVTAGTGTRIRNSSFYNFNTGIHYLNGGMWVITECFFRDNRNTGLLIQNARLPEEGDQVVSNSWFYGTDGSPYANQRGITKKSSGGTKVYGCKFNNGFRDCIFIQNSGNASVSVDAYQNNSFEGFYGHGIRIDSSIYSASNIIISGNEMYARDTFPGVGIGLYAINSGLVITGNAFFTETPGLTNPAILLGNTTSLVHLGNNAFSAYTRNVQDNGATYRVNNVYDNLVLAIPKKAAESINFKWTPLSTNALRLSSSINGAAYGNNIDFGPSGNLTLATGSLTLTAGNVNIPAAGFLNFGNNNPLIGADAALIGTGSGGGAVRYNGTNGLVFGGGSAEQYFKNGFALFNTSGGNPTTSIPASAVVEVRSTTKGLLLPRMTGAQGSAISSPADGLLIYVTATDATFTSVGFWGRVAGVWTALHL